MDIQKAQDFIRTHARPLELAEYNCRFHNGPKPAVIEALRPYQNPDGGFGHALEPDSWNPNSSPITTNAAIYILQDTGCLEEPEAQDMISSIARYLLSHDGYDEATGLWQFEVPTNNDYPHAIWWEYSGKPTEGYNPTVSLAAFLVCYGEGDMSMYKETVRAGFRALKNDRSSDGLKCFIHAYHMLRDKGVGGLIDFDQALELLREAVAGSICREIEKYGVEYVPGPFDLVRRPDSELITGELRPYMEAELKAIDSQQMEDGGFDITWKWWTPYEKEYEQSRAWWRPRVTMEKLEAAGGLARAI